MFEFMCFRSSQEKLFYESYYSIETDALQNFVTEFTFSKTAVPLQHY